MKFHQNIFNSYQIIEWTPFWGGQTEVGTDIQMQGEKQYLQHFTTYHTVQQKSSRLSYNTSAIALSFIYFNYLPEMIRKWRLSNDYFKYINLITLHECIFT